MLTAKKTSLVELLSSPRVSNGLARLRPKNTGVSEEFCESFHEASMAAMQDIKKGKKPKFVKVA